MTLQHVGIELAPADLDGAVEFFELLGFERVEPPPALREGFTWLQRGGTQIHLMHEDAPVVPPRGHIALVVPELEATIARLRERGYEVRTGREHWGAARAHVVGPGGHQVELMAAPPTS